MYKLKTKKSVSKRIKISKNGKVMRRQAFRRHLKASKTKKQLSRLKKNVAVTGSWAKKIKRSLGVSTK